MTLKYEGFAKPGDRIRSYDFIGREDCYVEGVVQHITDTPYCAFVIIVDKDVWPVRKSANGSINSFANRVGGVVLVPMEVAGMDYDGRIVNLSNS